MSQSLLTTKFFIPTRRATAVARPDLVRHLNENLFGDSGFARKLTLVSAPAGFGKTSIVAEWLAGQDLPVAWLALDPQDADPVRFLTYIVGALEAASLPVDSEVYGALQSPQSPTLSFLLTGLVNELAGIPGKAFLVLDDYQCVASPALDDILLFLIENGPPQLHIVLITRHDPGFPLARLRARAQLLELRTQDLKFTVSEVELFFRVSASLSLSAEEIRALEARSEGWIAGLQMAALALQGSGSGRSPSESVAAFTGSHRFVQDYFVDEVLSKQTEAALAFLVTTSYLGRFNASLCEEVLDLPAGSGTTSLAALERSNLFLVPLDGDRRWYRYHHLFAELLQKRLPGPVRGPCPEPSEIHRRASAWFDRNDYIVEAFRHAAASGDVIRTEALISDPRMRTYTRDVLFEIIEWLTGLPAEIKDSRPSLWVKSATFPLMAGQTQGVEERLRSAESALRGREAGNAYLLGQIAMARSALAISRYRMEEAKSHARRSLEILPDGPSVARLGALYSLGTAYQHTGDREEARKIFDTILPISLAGGATFLHVLTLVALGDIEERSNRLHAAQEAYEKAIDLSSRHPQPGVCDAYLGLARIHYQWNQLSDAAAFAEQALALANQYDSAIDRHILSEVFLARIDLARGDPEGAERRLAEAEKAAVKHRFELRLPEIAAEQAYLRLARGRIPDSAGSTTAMRIRIHLARKDFGAASRLAASLVEATEDRGEAWLQGQLLSALTRYANDDQDAALETLKGVFSVTRPEGFLRIFADEGAPMRGLIGLARSRGVAPDYTDRILAACDDAASRGSPATGKLGPISPREYEVLSQMATGLSNDEIAEKLFLSTHTVKVHIRNIFGKLSVANRTSAVAKARSMGLLG